MAHSIDHWVLIMMALDLSVGPDARQAALPDSRKKRFRRACAILALLPLLGGCVAVPVVAGAAMIVGGERLSIGAATPVPDSTSSAVPSTVAEVERYIVAQQQLTELPPPDALTGAWEPFINYALEHRIALEGNKSPRSAILAPLTSATIHEPRRRPCTTSTPAVIVDLDDGPTTFSGEQSATPAPGLASALSRLRGAGIVVLWISNADANDVTQVAEALRTSGLDPNGQDPLLLAFNDESRKQVLRDRANEDVCILAIAGDQNSDFDELFDHLRELEYGDFVLSLMKGKGWFVVPTPIPSVPGRSE